ncbi:hypothetical protein MMC06_000924 [Schaereria dolodes]|nr:hypothetical protein [Schaereria dolodes]
MPDYDPTNKAEAAWTHSQELAGDDSASVNIQEVDEATDNAYSIEEQPQEVEETGDATNVAIEKPVRLKDKSGYGSAARRASRNVKKSKELPRVAVPDWFIERNVMLHEANSDDKGLRLLVSPRKGGCSNPSDLHDPAQTMDTSTTKGVPVVEERLSSAGDEAYQIDQDILLEISAAVSAGLRLQNPPFLDSYPASKTHLVLHCPKDGGMFFLGAVVKSLAASHSADLIMIDAQDIAEIGSDSFGVAGNKNSGSLRSLGYHVHLMMERYKSEQEDENAEDENEYDEDETLDEADVEGHNKPPGFLPGRVSAIPIIGSLTDLMKKGMFMSNSTRNQTLLLPSLQAQFENPSGSSSDNPEAVKANLLIDAILNAHMIKRQHSLVDKQNAAEPRLETLTEAKLSPGAALAAESYAADAGEMSTLSAVGTGQRQALIVSIQDYAEMNGTRNGGIILKMLHEVVQKRRKEGHRVLIVGTTSAKDLIPSLSRSGFHDIQTEAKDGPTRTIITPCKPIYGDTRFIEDEKKRTLQINIRHLRDVLLRMDTSITADSVSDVGIELGSAQIYASGLNESVWPFERIFRTAAVALGMVQEGDCFTPLHINRALALIDSSDDAKYKWITNEKEEAEKHVGPLNGKSSLEGISNSANVRGNRMKKLRKTCNAHEMKLLNGVVDAESIRTTFRDVRAPDETIEALKTLTTLSLIRPEAFTYGVLATDKIPGLLLYGPPGTGKTLLAKAVAKESGATVLEISGSDVYDMYIGEGEKNVRAIFTLAKKLSPCIVFIDEADAIFGSRGTSNNRTSHRELINQFLREWDGMDDLSAFIMVATNRPFDLDDAVLRRLPRRLLVDLPLEKDREAILQIHLKDEILDPSVSFSTLAGQTPFYSGSDLKNLAVAAALACVREENDTASAHTGAKPHAYPEKRVIAKRHFDKAMEEISASISEDMSSLAAIRKFDERFGDRRARRKKGGGYGFGTMTEKERDNVDNVRVRAQEKL